jgi:RimJ/RimL family protein N-acetyltransferase
MIELRPATPKDAEDMTETHIAAWRAAYRGIVSEAFLDGLDPQRRAERFRQFLRSGAGETYIIVRDGRVVGHVTIGPCRDDDLDPTYTGEIWGIYLMPEDWRQGIGTEVCHRTEAILGARGVRCIVLWTFEANGTARRFYEAMGYALDGGKTTIEVGDTLPIVRYRKELSAGAEKCAT